MSVRALYPRSLLGPNDWRSSWGCSYRSRIRCNVSGPTSDLGARTLTWTSSQFIWYNYSASIPILYKVFERRIMAKALSKSTRWCTWTLLYNNLTGHCTMLARYDPSVFLCSHDLFLPHRQLRWSRRCLRDRMVCSASYVFDYSLIKPYGTGASKVGRIKSTRWTTVLISYSGLSIVQVMLIWLVQALYLARIWKCTFVFNPRP